MIRGRAARTFCGRARSWVGTRKSDAKKDWRRSSNTTDGKPEVRRPKCESSPNSKAMQQRTDGGLVRAIRRWDLVALFINSIIGAGIFGLPSKLYALSGTYSLLAFVI